MELTTWCKGYLSVVTDKKFLNFWVEKFLSIEVGIQRRVLRLFAILERACDKIGGCVELRRVSFVWRWILVKFWAGKTVVIEEMLIGTWGEDDVDANTCFISQRGVLLLHKSKRSLI